MCVPDLKMFYISIMCMKRNESVHFKMRNFSINLHGNRKMFYYKLFLEIPQSFLFLKKGRCRGMHQDSSCENL